MELAVDQREIRPDLAAADAELLYEHCVTWCLELLGEVGAQSRADVCVAEDPWVRVLICGAAETDGWDDPKGNLAEMRSLSQAPGLSRGTPIWLPVSSCSACGGSAHDPDHTRAPRGRGGFGASRSHRVDGQGSAARWPAQRSGNW